MRQDLVDGAPTQLVGLPDEDGTDPVVVVVCDSGRASNRGDLRVQSFRNRYSGSAAGIAAITFCVFSGSPAAWVAFPATVSTRPRTYRKILNRNAIIRDFGFGW